MITYTVKIECHQAHILEGRRTNNISRGGGGGATSISESNKKTCCCIMTLSCGVLTIINLWTVFILHVEK